LHPLWLAALALAPPALAGDPSAVVPLEALQAPEEDPAAPPERLLLDSLAVRLRPGAETGVAVDLTLQALEPGWIDLPVTGGALAVGHATLDGAPVALPARTDGLRHLTAELSGQHLLRIEGSVATPGHALQLPLPQAARAQVEIADPGWDVELADAVRLAPERFALIAAQRLDISWRPAAAPAPKPRHIALESATALLADESGLQGRAVLRFQVSHGSAESLSFRLPGSPDSLEVTGPGVLDHQLAGDMVTVRLARPLEGSVSLDVAFRAPPPGADQARAAPLPVPEGVGDHQGFVTMARGDTSMLVPQPGRGLEVIASSGLPDWATGLVPGTPIVSYRLASRDPQLDYRLLRYDPVEAPPTLVDEARYAMAVTAHGRVLLRARYTVRNDRRQYLHLVPPAGFEVLGVRVAGQVRQPVADGQGGISIPLEKSLESLQGLISFPVDVYLLGKERSWTRRGDRQLLTPAVDAPVAYARWEVYLPPQVEARDVSGVPRQVERWTSSEGGLSYGRAHKDPSLDQSELDDDYEEEEEDFEEPAIQFGRDRPRRGLRKADTAAPPADDAGFDLQEDRSLELFNQAYQAYNANKFSEAQGLLEQSLQLDPANASAQALLSNVGVVTGGQQAGGEGEAQARRVRELAKARTVDTQLEQKKVEEAAEQALRAGDMERAEHELARLTDMTRELQQLEQKESAEQRLLLEEAERKLEETRSKMKKKEVRKDAPSSLVSSGKRGEAIQGQGWGTSAGPVADAPPGEPSWDEDGKKRRVFIFEEEMIMGEEEVEATEEEAPTKGEPEPEIVYKSRTEIDFDAIDISGELVKPQGQLLLDRKQADMSPLIDLRNDFDGEISVDLPEGGHAAELGDLDGLLADELDLRGADEGKDIGIETDAEKAPLGEEAGLMSWYDDAISQLDPFVQEILQLARDADAAVAAAEAQHDVAALSCLTSRQASLHALSTVAAGVLAQLEAPLPPERVEHELRKLQVAHAKSRQLWAEAGMCSAGGEAGAAAVSVELEYAVEAPRSASRSSRRSGGFGGLSIFGGGRKRSASAEPAAPAAAAPEEPVPELLEIPDRFATIILSDEELDAPVSGTDDQPIAVSEAAPMPVAAPAPKPVPTSTSTRRAPVPEAPPPPPPAQPALPPPGKTKALPAPQQTVSASHFVINIPQTGQRRAFEQLLVAAGEPLSVEIRYRTRSRP